MATKKVVIVDFTIKTDDIGKKLGKLKEDTTRLKLENKELNKSLEQAIAEDKPRKVAQLSKAIAANETQLKILNKQYGQYTQTLEKVNQFQVAAEGSYEQLLREYELGQTQLKLMANTLVKNKQGELELSAEYKNAAEQLKKKKDALDAFNKGIGDNRSLVGSYGDAIKEAFGEGGVLSKSLGALGPAFRVASEGATLFKGGINGIGAALKANPLGLLTSAFQLFQQLIAKNNTLTETFRVILAGFNSVVGGLTSVFFKLGSVIFSAFSEPKKILEGIVEYINGTFVQNLKGIGNIIKGVFTLNFGSIKEGAGQVAGAYKNAVKPLVDGAKATGDYVVKLDDWATRGAAVAEETDAIEDAERGLQVQLKKNEVQIDNLIKQAKERTTDEKERLNLLNQAAELEKRNLKDQEVLAKRKLANIIEENKIAKEQGQLNDAMVQKKVDAETEVTTIVGQSANKQQEIENRKAKLIIEINKEILAQKKSFLDSELSLLEAQGKDTTAKRKEIAKNQRDAALEDAGTDAEKLKAAENNYQAELLNIRKEAAEKNKAAREAQKQKELELEKELSDAKLLLIQDDAQRQLAAIANEAKERIDAIKATGEERKIIEEAIARDIADKLNDVNEQIANETLQKRQESIEKNANASRSALQRQYTEEENAIKLSLSNREITEQEAAQQRSDLAIKRAQDELAIVTSTELGKAAALEDSIQKQKDLLQEQYDRGIIEQEDYQEELLEIETKAATDRENLKTKSNEVLLNAETNLQTATTDAQVLGNNTRLKNEEDTEKAKQEIQKKQIEALQATLSALAGLLGRDEESKKKNAKLLKTLAIAEVGINAYKEISGYWVGAGVDASKTGAIAAPFSAGIATALSAAAIARALANIAQITSKGNFADGGFTGNGIFPADGSGYKVAGVVHEGEYVVPKWMLMSSQIAPIVGSLERIRRSGSISGFADGGFTTAFKEAQANSLMSSDVIANAFDGAIKKVTIVASADEITSTQTITTNIVNGATI